MYAKKSIHFSERNMLIKTNAQNVRLQDGKRTTVKVKKILWKVLRYFLIKPRLQRLFMSKNIAKDMR